MLGSLVTALARTALSMWCSCPCGLTLVEKGVMAAGSPHAEPRRKLVQISSHCSPWKVASGSL